jgi:hypothetical protein
MSMVEVAGVMCYGEVQWDSNFDIVCEDEENDYIDCGDDTDGPLTWEYQIERLKKLNEDMVEVSAI